ncbi:MULTISPECIES: hypothetical protein [Leptolyngbya]|nr:MULTISPECIES: hypothetical protein [Leptolyngbya]MBD2366031.1 hypothetical protein [Leptolyngbya sp. FACHB-161]MBD2372211.1 hypothetical protein [Leptolyngbya sp. FACHB-238]MBD2396634.1 hypothetical protein [Leptolyngbya sp. FACHB-239]MBD2403157.1 hypothetical protein [Leptolyngbya sp. FACHB-402]ULP31957.1 hypothetical protein MCP04_09390 [Leptolyngbya boryana IU 594]
MGTLALTESFSAAGQFQACTANGDPGEFLSRIFGVVMSKRFTQQITARIPKGTLVLCASALTVWIGGCTVGEEPTVTSASPSPAASPSTSTQAFAKPTVPEKDKDKKDAATGKAGKVAGLLQSTDPAERARQVQRGINTKGKDPFSSIPPIVSFKVPIKLPETANQPAVSPNVGDRSIAKQPAVVSRPNPKVVAAKSPEQSPIKALPPLPDPTLAKSVQVTGVIVVAGVPQAIIQAPNEATSRYVQAGQRIAGGQVLVKRIEMNGGSDPLVILEQNGVEVARGVGSPVVAPNLPSVPPAPAAAVPTSNLFS